MYGVCQLVRTAQLQETEGLPMRKKGRKKEAIKTAAQERGPCFLFYLCVCAFMYYFQKVFV